MIRRHDSRASTFDDVHTRDSYRLYSTHRMVSSPSGPGFRFTEPRGCWVLSRVYAMYAVSDVDNGVGSRRFRWSQTPQLARLTTSTHVEVHGSCHLSSAPHALDVVVVVGTALSSSAPQVISRRVHSEHDVLTKERMSQPSARVTSFGRLMTPDPALGVGV
jgi:hypothetical protein